MSVRLSKIVEVSPDVWGEAYTDAGMVLLAPVLKTAQRMVDEDAAGLVDAGIWVEDAGIQVWYVATGSSSPEQRIVVASHFWGCEANRQAVARALRWLQDNGVECSYYGGVLRLTTSFI